MADRADSPEPQDEHPSPIAPTPLAALPHVEAALIRSGLINASDVKELQECLSVHPKFADVFKSPDDLLHALKVIASVKPHERFSTHAGIYIHPEPQRPATWRDVLYPIWLIRLTNGEDRIANLKALKAVFVGALLVIEAALQEREHVFKPKDPLCRIDVVQKQKNEQTITRMTDAVTRAVESLNHLKQTYEGDASACARIDMLMDVIRDRLALVATSLQFLK